MNDKIQKYKDILENLEKKINNSSDNNIKSFLIDTYTKFIVELICVDKNSFIYCKDKIDKINISVERKNKIMSELGLRVLSKDLIEQERSLYNKLKEDFRNPNELLIKTWIDNYKDFIEKNQVYGFYTIDNIKKYFKELDTSGKYISLLNIDDKSIKVEEEIEEILSIIKIKRGIKSKSNILEAIVNKKNIIPSNIIAYIISKLYVGKSLTNKKHEVFMIQNGYSIDSNGEVIRDNNVINEDFIQKERTNYIKDMLLKRKKDGEISSSYKDNRFKTLLMNMSLVRSKYKMSNISGLSVDRDNTDIYKGMGKC